MQQKNKKRYILMGIFIVLAVIWMTVIYSFSEQTGEESGGLSDKVADIVSRVIPFEISEDGMDTLALIIRKLAHFTEYAVLGILYMAILVLWEKINRYILLINTVMCMIYAMTDEFHQSFTAGRTPSVTDVMIDTLGGLSGGVVCMLIIYLCKKRQKKRNGGIGNDI